MKKVLVLLAMVLGATNMYTQNIGDSFILDRLPLTSDDFQKFQFDYLQVFQTTLKECQ